MADAASSEFGEQHPRPLVKGAAFLRQLQAARAPFEQAQGEAGLQLPDPAGQGRLRASRSAGSPAEPPVPGDEVEIGEGEEVHTFHL